MNVALRRPQMSREEFLAWAEGQAGRYEFDGRTPVAMTGGTFRHGMICQNLWAALRSRLRGSTFVCNGPDVGMATPTQVVRYPDAIVTASPVPGAARLVPGVVVVFEVVGPGSERTDRILKVQEYAAIDTVRQYVLLESLSAALTTLTRAAAGEPWTAHVVTEAAALQLPSLGIEIPLIELYEGVDLPEPADDGR